ncbi:hypothetical protein CKO28_01165 [Rhodovibrio sodomensis]|uniref:Uncharacterized protein n=1 Tax=Rhodovibrio sodomensis TaxID=1088 RepID=A0ABS1DA85_9PROT|nr:hypothetical protein [Rhodovibrio sodomensis]MBK1666653.1 hypothetical protein [Rhodovibrio sodomensis]
MRKLFRHLIAARRTERPAGRTKPPERAEPGARMFEKCPCGTTLEHMLRGPRGGSAQNIQCPDCGCWYNVGWLPGCTYPILMEEQGHRTDLDLRATAGSTDTIQ